VKQTKGVNTEVARLICKEYKISCAEIILREDITVDQVRLMLQTFHIFFFWIPYTFLAISNIFVVLF
jgi:ribosome-interacting GTPase 1